MGYSMAKTTSHQRDREDEDDEHTRGGDEESTTTSAGERGVEGARSWSTTSSNNSNLENDGLLSSLFPPFPVESSVRGSVPASSSTASSTRASPLFSSGGYFQEFPYFHEQTRTRTAQEEQEEDNDPFSFPHATNNPSPSATCTRTIALLDIITSALEILEQYEEDEQEHQEQ
jgi:hypothetical protein